MESITPTSRQSRFNPGEAWSPLPPSEWNEDAARHLLRRATWTAQPEDVARAVQEGLPKTLARLFPEVTVPFPKSRLVASLQEDSPEFAVRIKDASPDQKRVLQREARERSQQAMQDMSIKWLQFAAEPEHASAEKWVLFLSDIYVVAFEKVYNSALIYLHHDILRRHAFGSAPALTKAVSRSPAMINYLDLRDSKKEAPNENFARELFELFVLGEGNYTEKDIKEAARAFTGYRQRFGEFIFIRNQHDADVKTVFGKSGNYSGDDVIDLAYELPASSLFLPREMARFYLSEESLPPELLAELGQWWTAQGQNLQALAQHFFGSRLFFEPSYRGNYIKSPIQFYLGLVQDLRLDVAPLPRQVLGSLRQMGQTLFNPPNVRGWVGGRAWINSATLSARRQLVQALFTPINEDNLNADEQFEMVAARSNGHDHFTVDAERLKEFLPLKPDEVAARFVDRFLPVKVDQSFRQSVQDFLASDGSPARHGERVRNTAVTLLQSPEYQLC